MTTAPNNQHDPCSDHRPPSRPEQSVGDRLMPEAARPPAWLTWRDQFVWTRETNPDVHPMPRTQLWRSWTDLPPGPGAGDLRPPIGFDLIDSWSLRPYRLVWLCLEQRIILTYCEGDLAYVTAEDGPALRSVLVQHAQFYRDH